MKKILLLLLLGACCGICYSTANMQAVPDTQAPARQKSPPSSSLAPITIFNTL